MEHSCSEANERTRGYTYLFPNILSLHLGKRTGYMRLAGILHLRLPSETLEPTHVRIPYAVRFGAKPCNNMQHPGYQNRAA